jgi:SnoaL-like domain
MSLPALQAKQAITEQMYSYCRGLDRMDRALTRSVWHPDGLADYRPHYRGGADGFVDWVWGSHAQLLGHVHHITNILIELTEPAAAVSEAQALILVRAPSEGSHPVTSLLSVRYLDRWSCRDGRWALDARRLVTDATEHVATHDRPWSAHRDARRGPDDPSYALLGR